MGNSLWIGEPLISKGADINAKDIIYLNIILLCLIKIIENKLRKVNKKNRTPLHDAASSRDEHLKEIGEVLISKGANINAKDIICLNIIILFLINLI